MEINTNKIYLGKVMPISEKVRQSKYRTSENGYSDEFHRFVEDEAEGIAETKKGYCFNEKQLEAIKISLKNKLTSEEYATLEWKKEDGYFKITFKRTRKNIRKNKI